MLICPCFFAVVRTPLKWAHVDNARTSRLTAEEVLSPTPVSGPVLVDSPSPADPALEVALTESGERAPTLPPSTAEPMVVSLGEGNQGARAADCPLSSSGDPEVRGLLSGLSGSLRRGESPSFQRPGDRRNGEGIIACLFNFEYTQVVYMCLILLSPQLTDVVLAQHRADITKAIEHGVHRKRARMKNPMAALKAETE